ncbi:site-2 protease family protein [Candidatus Uhrbacteria bacterium]|nr:site-2 protease family protein [Candidatus Uhrbacteria bacterium]
MILSLFLQDPLLSLAALIAVVFSLTLHEFTHAAIGTFLGDPTAKNEGRLSLNPFVHIDIWGFLLLLTSGFGWAKPVPFNPYALRFRWGGTFLIALSGPAMNIFLATIAAVFIRTLSGVEYPSESIVIQFFNLLFTINVILALFNCIPIPPLDGARALLSLLPERYEEWKVHYERVGPFLLVLMIIGDSWSGINIFGSLLERATHFISVFIS